MNEYENICEDIAKDIESIKHEFLQLKEFGLKNLNKETCTIIYQYKCGPSENLAGWRGSVPNPKPDGIWLYFSIWDEQSENIPQINQQIAGIRYYIKDRRVTYLILEGNKTKSVNNEILKILKKHGLITLS